MSNVSILSSGASNFVEWLNDFAESKGLRIGDTSDTSATVINNAGETFVLTGTGFSYLEAFGTKFPVSGNVTGAKLTTAAGGQVSVDTFSVSIGDVYDAARKSGDAVVALFQSINFAGSDAVDTVLLGAADDFLNGKGGSDVLDGAGGTDTAIFSGARAAYTVAKLTDGSYTVVSGAEIDTLKNIEKVQFSDGTVDIASLVTPVADNVAPVISSNGGKDTVKLSIAENKMAVTTVVAGDADGDKLTWSLSGADAKLFTLNAGTGALAFKAAPDFEMPRDAGKNNTYDVTVKVSDGSVFDTQALSIKVTNVPGVTKNGTSKGETLTGSGEEDRLSGKGGNDTLKGLGGADTFVFDTALSTRKAPNVDKLTDFSHSDDTIELSNDAKVFAGLKAGHLAEGAFNLIASATATKGVEKDDRILYDKAHGDIYFDRDGSGSTYARVKFAEVADKTALDHTDFLIV